MNKNTRLIILDDDPTGIQTVHGCLLITDCTDEQVKVALQDDQPFFYILTLNGTGTHYVDGEGRYYHQGLYLSKSKYDQLVPGAKLQGPQMWGCKMKSYEDDRVNGYIPGGKYPNGLDCSGFVSWTLYNGGFDVGDGGAGESPYIDGQMTDTGKYMRLTQGMIDRGEVRVGDLLNIYGHIAIIAGDDGENFYVAESLNNYKGVILKKYSKKKVIQSFPYVVLMDEVYKSDGNLTNMWY